jgi:vacuolar-type H+-ATPase subunit I/STV1
MAKKKEEKQEKTNEKSKKMGCLFTLLTLLIAILIVGGSIGGVAYIIVKNNTNGVADKYRIQINQFPILKDALPKLQDPDDPQFLSATEIANRYNKLRKEKKDLLKEIDELLMKVEEQKDVQAESEKTKKEMEQMKKEIEQEKVLIEAEKAKIDKVKAEVGELIANGDRDSFKAYFQDINPDAAEAIFREFVKEDEINEETQKFITLYETIDPNVAAQIFQDLGLKKIDLLTEVLWGMHKDASAQILAAMETRFASRITENMSINYIEKEK